MEVVEYFTQGLWVAMRVTAPLLLAVTCVGLLVALFQALTQIQEQTIQFFAKIVVCFAVIALMGQWGSTEVVKLTINAFDFARIAGR